MARSSLLHYHQSFADPSFYDLNSQPLQPAVGLRQDTPTRPQLFDNYHHMQAMAQPYNVSAPYPQSTSRLKRAMQQQYRSSDRGLNHQQWQYQAHMQPGGAQAGQQATAAIFSRDRVWIDGGALDRSLNVGGRPHMQQTIPQLDGSYGNGALVYPESASQLGTNSTGGCAGPWPTPESYSHSGSGSDAFERGTNDSLSPKSYDSETQPSEAQPFTPKSVPSATSIIGDWSCGSAQPYTVGKASSPNATWSIEHGSGLDLSSPQQHGLDMHMPTTSPIGSSQGFHGLPAIYSETSQHGSDYSYSQHSSPGPSPGFHGGPSHSSLAYRSNNLLANSPAFHGLPYQGQTRMSSDMSAVPTYSGGSHRSVSRRENGQALSEPENSADFHAQRREDDAILLEGKRNGLTYKDIRKKMHKKCAESTLRGRYRSLTKARQDRVRKPVWRQKDVSLLVRPHCVQPLITV